MKRTLAPVLALGLAAFALAGCTSDPEPEPSPTAVEETTTATEPEPTETAEDQCATLDEATIAELAGSDLTSQTTEVSGISACLWGSLDDVGVQVVRVGADLWAAQLPAIIDQVRSTGLLTDDQLEQLDQATADIEAGESIEPDRACELFTQVLEANGQPAGTTTDIRFVPDATNVLAVTGQGCVDGVYGSVTLVRPDLEGSETESDAVQDALDALLAAG